jgi:hypothetical protein
MRQTHRQLEKQGWLRQFVADEAQAKDAVEIYDLLGYEVHLEPPKRPRSKKGCSSCPTQSQDPCQIVYVRPRGSPEDEEE